jgi:hypothetical protein
MKDKSEEARGVIGKGFGLTPANAVSLLLVLSFCGAIIGIIGGISHFQPAQSTVAQRAWTLLWTVTGFAWIIIKLVIDFVSYSIDVPPKSVYGLKFMVAILLIAPSIGGFVVVGQMLRTYGTCVVFS